MINPFNVGGPIIISMDPDASVFSGSNVHDILTRPELESIGLRIQEKAAQDPLTTEVFTGCTTN